LSSNQGALSATFRQANGIEITPTEEAHFRRTPLTFGATLTIREGENLISVGLVDQAGGTMGFARTTVTASAHTTRTDPDHLDGAA
jgi:hypothetical protein